MKKSLSIFAIGCGLALAATGCTVGTETAGSDPVVTEASTAAPASEAPPSTSPAPSTSAPSSPTRSTSAPDVEESLAEFGQTWEYKDGMAVTVTHEGTAQASQYAAGGEETAGQMHVFKVTIKNGTEAIFDPVGAYTTVNYGDDGQVAERVFDSEQGYGDMWQGKILPGKKQSLSLAFAIPTDVASDVLLSVAPGFEYEDALFHGTLGK
ncbi:hypothetical protein [Arthrobacter pigmenti]